MTNLGRATQTIREHISPLACAQALADAGLLVTDEIQAVLDTAIAARITEAVVAHTLDLEEEHWKAVDTYIDSTTP